LDPDKQGKLDFYSRLSIVDQDNLRKEQTTLETALKKLNDTEAEQRRIQAKAILDNNGAIFSNLKDQLGNSLPGLSNLAIGQGSLTIKHESPPQTTISVNVTGLGGGAIEQLVKAVITNILKQLPLERLPVVVNTLAA